jgi:hypothetical protein
MGGKTFIGYARKLLWACEVAALNMLAGANANPDWESVGPSNIGLAPLPFPDDYLSDIPCRVVTDGLKCLTGMQRAGLLTFKTTEDKIWTECYTCVLQIGACTYMISGTFVTIDKRAAEFAVAFCNVDARQMECLGEDLPKDAASANSSSSTTPTSVVIDAPKTEHERMFDALATGVRAVPGFPSEVEDFITRLRKMVKDGSLTQERSNRMLLYVLQETVSGRWVVADSIFDGGYSGKIIRKTLEEVAEPAKPLPACPPGWSLVDGVCLKPTETTPPKPIAPTGPSRANPCDACPKGTTPVNGVCVSVNSVEHSKRMRDFVADVKAVPSTAGNQATSVVLTEKEYELFGKPLSSTTTPVEPKTLIAEAASSKPVESDASPAPSAAIDPKVNITMVNTEITEYIKLTNFRRAMNDPQTYLDDLVDRHMIESALYNQSRLWGGVLCYVEIKFPGGGEPMRFAKTDASDDPYKSAAREMFHIFG